MLLTRLSISADRQCESLNVYERSEQCFSPLSRSRFLHPRRRISAFPADGAGGLAYAFQTAASVRCVRGCHLALSVRALRGWGALIALRGWVAMWEAHRSEMPLEVRSWHSAVHQTWLCIPNRGGPSLQCTGGASGERMCDVRLWPLFFFSLLLSVPCWRSFFRRN